MSAAMLKNSVASGLMVFGVAAMSEEWTIE